jgi:perosamine synthetase
MTRFQVSKPVLAGRESEFVLDALQSGWISSTGPYVDRFEKAFAERIQVDECISVCNGTAALHLACLAMQLKPGDEVVVPSLTYVATANVVAYCGATPVLADSDMTTWNLTAATVAAAITPKTVGVIAVHLYGFPCPMPEISALCRERGLWLIEDCAESIGASIRGRPTGGFGDAAAFSFYGNKTISTGEGGMLAVSDERRRAHARMLRGQGMDPNVRYWHPIIGYNYRMTNVAAAIGCGQLEQYDLHLGERRRIANAYVRCLQGLEASNIVALPPRMNEFESSSWLFSLVLKSGGAARRQAIMAHLEREGGIETRPFFVPMHRLPMYGADRPLPNADFLGDHGMNLPTYTGLTDQDVEEISAAICDAVQRF